MVEIITKLESRYKINGKKHEVTPLRIQKTEEGNVEWTADDVYNNLDKQVIRERFTSHHGNPKLNPMRRFIHDARRLLAAGYDPIDLVKMNEDCIKKNGTIDEEQLTAFLNGDEEI